MPKKKYSSIGRKAKSGTGNSKRAAKRKIAPRGFVKRLTQRVRLNKGANGGDKGPPTNADPSGLESPSISITHHGDETTHPQNVSSVATAEDSGASSSSGQSTIATHDKRTIVDATDDSSTFQMSAHKRRKIENAETVTLNPDAFAKTVGGKERSSVEAANLAKRRAIRKVIDEIFSHETDEQRAIILQGLINHSEMAPYVKAVGLISEDNRRVVQFIHEQQQKMIAEAAATDHPRGRPPNDQRNFLRAFGIGSAADKESQDAPNLNQQARAFSGLNLTTARRLLENGARLREALRSGIRVIRWSTGRSRVGYSKVTKEIREALDRWIREHPQVLESPIVNDTILIYNPLTGKKDKCVPKLLLMISVRELHNDLLKPVEEGGFEYAWTEDGKVLISDTMLRSLKPKELKTMTERHKQMCGCETCIVGRGMLQALKAHRARTSRKIFQKAREMPDGNSKVEAMQKAEAYKATVYHPDGKPKISTVQEAIKLLQCPDVEELGHPKWCCVLRTCKNCPNYGDSIPAEEKCAECTEMTNITFDMYLPYTKCSQHGLLALKAKECEACKEMAEGKKKGKIRTKKELTRLTRPIGTFHEEYFKPALEALAYHWPHVTMLGKRYCSRTRKEAFFNALVDILTRRDYAERLKTAFNGEIQSTHFGNNRDLSMEGSSVQFLPEAVVGRSRNENIKPTEKDIELHFHSHLSDESAQDAYTTHAHMKVLIKGLQSKGMLKSYSTMWDDTDGCMKQYRSGIAMYLLSVLAVTYCITIDRAIGAPGHGKDLVDGLNAIDKRFLKGLFCRINTPDDADDQRKISPHSMTENGEFSFAREAAKACSDPLRSSGVKGGAKHAKREADAKLKQRVYHVQDADDVMHRSLKKVATGFQGGKHNGVMGHYNVRADPYLGIGKVAVRRIPCACTGCHKQLQLEWQSGVPSEEQQCYAASTTCKFHVLFEGLNDWKIITLVDTTESVLEENEQVHELVLAGIAETVSKNVIVGGYGAVMTDDPDSDGYYLLQWDSEPRALEEDLEVEYATILKGELVADAVYLNPVPRARQWYTRATQEDEESLRTVVRMQHVVAADISLSGESASQKLPNNCDRTTARQLGALRVSDDKHNLIADEISRREVLDFIEEVADAMEE